VAVEVEASGQVDEFVRVLRKRIWWIVVPFVVIGSLGCFFAVVVPKKFVSETEIMVRDPSAAATEFARLRDTQNEGKIAPFTIRAPARVAEVLSSLNWSDYRVLSGPEASEYVRDRLVDTRVSLEEMPEKISQQLVKISYRDTNPDRATQFLIKLTDSWTNDVLRSNLAAAERELASTDEELENTKERLRSVGEEMEALRAEFGIPPRPANPTTGVAQFSSPVFGQLASAEVEVDRLEGDSEDLRTEIEVMQARRDRLPELVRAPDALPSDPVRRQIESIDRQIQALQIEIDDHDWSSSHSEYLRRQREIDTLRARRREALATADRTSFSEFDDDMVPNEERLRIERQIEEKQTLLEITERQLSRARARFTELRQDAELAQDAISTLQYLGAQEIALGEALTSLENAHQQSARLVSKFDGPSGDPFSVQLRPTVPTEATSPNPWVISIGSLLFGLGVGFGLALLREYSKAVFRTPRDIARVMPHPVLGRVNTIRTRRERARTFLVQCVFGGGSLLFALSTAYVTWSWARDREGLTRPLVDAIESFQQLLK